MLLKLQSHRHLAATESMWLAIGNNTDDTVVSEGVAASSLGCLARHGLQGGWSLGRIQEESVSRESKLVLGAVVQGRLGVIVVETVPA